MMSEAIFLRHICCARRKNRIKAAVLVVWDRPVCLCMYLLFSELSHACGSSSLLPLLLISPPRLYRMYLRVSTRPPVAGRGCVWWFIGPTLFYLIRRPAMHAHDLTR